MEFKRERYLNELIKMRHSSFVKVITGLRRSGKTYLLFNLYKNYLFADGVPADHIFEMSFDDPASFEYSDCMAFYSHVKDFVSGGNGWYYILLDEVQLLDRFESVLTGLMRLPNVDIYVTGSNSRFLSKDVITEFRGRGWEIHVWPLSFAEFMECYDGDKYDGWEEYVLYGGMPEAALLNDDNMKAAYLRNLFSTVYLKDIVSRHRLRNESEMEEILNILASSVGSLTNPGRLTKRINSVKYGGREDKGVTLHTVMNYMEWLCDAYIVDRSMRYDIKGNKYIDTPSKYYYTDIGLRNARVNFRQSEETHMMENVIYNELKMRGYGVDVGVVEINEKKNGESVRTLLETDFVCNLGSKRVYIQSAFAMPDKDKENQELRSLQNIRDNFKKIVVTKGNFKPWYTEEGILVISIYDFLLNPDSIDL